MFTRNQIAQVRDTFVGQCSIVNKNAKFDVVVPRGPGHIGRCDEDSLGVGDNQFGMKLPATLAANRPRIVIHTWTSLAGPPRPEPIVELSYYPSIGAVIALVARHVEDQVYS